MKFIFLPVLCYLMLINSGCYTEKIPEQLLIENFEKNVLTLDSAVSYIVREYLSDSMRFADKSRVQFNVKASKPNGTFWLMKF